MICFINVLRIFERADPAHQSRARREFEQPHVVEVVAARELGRHRVEAREGRIKVIFRALKIVKPKSAIVFINSKFNDLIIFAKEICLLMEDLEDDEPNCFDDLLDDVINAILTPPASSVQLIRTWLLEIFSRGIIEIPPPKLKKIEALPAVIDKRQLLLIRGRTGDKNFFRKHKDRGSRFFRS